MKNLFKMSVVALTMFLTSCSSNDKPTASNGFTEESPAASNDATSNAAPAQEITEASTYVDLKDKGIGPVKEVKLAPEIDQALAAKGKEEYEQKCTACHKPDKKFIGPAHAGILDRRSPEWVMNMILNPEEMTEKDPIAHALLKEFNGTPMSNQGLSEPEARSILEYFRTLK